MLAKENQFFFFHFFLYKYLHIPIHIPTYINFIFVLDYEKKENKVVFTHVYFV